ncbi:E3 ubiquitin-protein ligase TRIM13 [Alligator mississippiensis]|uniref:E3 ubiquitin-protein ligase TRIM13 n=1 Tax=Alligator mississippiensis TaxID=8496 RepID=A0A151NC39_ALLMI|nr:E3 ubiquitin-protein ligase TRIM13 [Alligator mississippiensis]
MLVKRKQKLDLPQKLQLLATRDSGGPSDHSEASYTEDWSLQGVPKLWYLYRWGYARHICRDMMELLEEDLTCPICCSLFDDPRVLPCSHNFCKKCLEGILEGNVRNVLWRPSLFKCPTCRKETPVTGVNSLQVNYSLKGIVEKYNKIKRGGKDSWSSCLKIGASIMISTIRKYVSIKPDARKLINGTNVLGLLVDTLLKEGFHLEMVCNQLKYQHDF